MNTKKEKSLIGHWPLADNICNQSSHDLQCSAQNLSFVSRDGHSGALFDGIRSRMEIADHPALRWGGRDFSIALWLHTTDSANGGDIVGDLLSKFDADTRRGMNLICSTQTGVTQTTQSNYRHLQFGIDSGIVSPQWTDCGRPGQAVQVSALAAVEGSLYAGTFEHGEGRCGHLWRYESDGSWTDLGTSPDRSNDIPSIACHEGSLYCSSGRFNPLGSLLGEWKNSRPGGRVYRIEVDGTWTDCGHPGSEGASPDDPNVTKYSSDQADSATCLTVFRGSLYCTSHHRRGIYRYEGGKDWKHVGPDLRIMSITVHQGRLYALINSGAENVYEGVYVYEADNHWKWCGAPPKSTQTYCAVTYRGDLLVGTWPEAEIIRYDGGESWTLIDRVGFEREIMGVALYNGKCYFGTLPMANVFRMDGNRFTFFGNIDNDSSVHLRRAWSMAVYRGEMFVGSLPQGKVLRRRAGCMATCDRSLPPGWRHVVVSRHGDRLQVFLDGRKVTETIIPESEKFDLDNDQPLLIGSGIGHALNAVLRDVLVYSRALTEEEIRGLASGESETP